MNPQETALNFKRRRYRTNISKSNIENIVLGRPQAVKSNQPPVMGQTQYEGAMMKHYSNQSINQSNLPSTQNQTSYTPESAAQQRQDSVAKITSALNNNKPSRRPVTGGNFNFTMEDYLRGNEFQHTKDQLAPEHYKNAENLINKINALGQYIDYNDQLNSTYRTPEEQRKIYRERNLGKPAMDSKHLSGHAVDINDPYGELKQKIKGNLPALYKAKELGLYFENFSKTDGWVHIQDEPPPNFTGGQIWSPDDFLEGNKIRYIKKPDETKTTQ